MKAKEQHRPLVVHCCIGHKLRPLHVSGQDVGEYTEDHLDGFVHLFDLDPFLDV